LSWRVINEPLERIYGHRPSIVTDYTFTYVQIHGGKKCDLTFLWPMGSMFYHLWNCSSREYKIRIQKQITVQSQG